MNDEISSQIEVESFGFSPYGTGVKKSVGLALWPCHKAGMKNKTINPTRSQFNILRQICNFIPPNEVPKIARITGVQDRSRTFKPWSHVVSLVYAQLTHSIGLNDLCDSLQLHSGPLASIRGATAASRNGLSNANRERPAEMAEQLFWRVLSSLGEQSPGFVAGRRRGAAFRFKLPIHVVDTTVMELVCRRIKSRRFSVRTALPSSAARPRTSASGSFWPARPSS